MSSNPPPPPVSLGKPSLRHRLESYYSLVSPEAIADAIEWKRKFEIIYNKYGGSVEGETKLSQKLAKKYGQQVMLLVAPPHRSMRSSHRQDRNISLSLRTKHEETYYDMDESQRGSKVLNFTSEQFDAAHALIAPERDVINANPSLIGSIIQQSQKLDNISKFRSMLPQCDPQSVEPKARNIPNKTAEKLSNSADTTKKKVPMLLAMSEKYEKKQSGPLSLLYSIVANRQRARVMVRYVDCIRGTLTGFVLAFDKHFNMIMRDVDEVYGGRITQHIKAVEAVGGSQASIETSTADIICAPPKAKLEAQRRKCYPPDGSGGPGPAVKQRYFHQLMVRGDNVVMVWRADAERSAHPLTKKSPQNSLYTNDATATFESKVGTPGSLYYALQRWESQNSFGRRR